MKKVMMCLLVLSMILSACSSSKLSLTKVEKVPDHIQKSIKPNLKLQSINQKKGYYIVLHTSGDVVATLDTKGDIVEMHFNARSAEDETVVQHVYWLTMGSDHDMIDVFVNGKQTTFDEVTITGEW